MTLSAAVNALIVNVPNEGGQSRKLIVQDVEASLKRLGTDYIDLLYFHKADPQAPFE